ncbi:lysophospholipid acyltransferase family protein [Paenibacillus sp. MMS18-CY102]|uniref:lysophospholipid acyltransferase family protein n=1 Tax=Paenibacillus sp. MMS18-CY102 TaxID=2682849 RepID=UPI001365543E|nr:lysophospholipid acyltransferase family protein [Paenibacillus sp. MMS18-CY102]MWC28443.1 1-acyl-sn-glycerol-3-phosphate acyltransferase [Paenibacillus sp. MMS18-CY102]
MVYIFCRALLRLLYGLLFRLQAVGREHVPTEGPVILASNHLSVLDPPTIGIKLQRKVNFMAKAELFDIPLFGRLIRQCGAFPVKRGGVSKESIRASIELLSNGGMMGIFPEGTRKSSGEAGKKGAAMIALRSGAAIVPVYIEGNYKLFRKMIVRYGPPVDLSDIIAEPSSDALERVTERIMNEIRSLRKK